MKSKKKVIFVHGVGGLDAGGWPYWLGRELLKYNFEYKILLMPDPMYPLVDEWLNYIREQNIIVDENTYFVGHSLGCITIARYLEELSKENVAGGCVLVAGFSSCSILAGPLLLEFCNRPLDFLKIKNQAKEFNVIISDNDKLIPSVLSEEFAKKLDAKIIFKHNMGHFQEDVLELPCVLNSILEMDSKRKI